MPMEIEGLGAVAKAKEKVIAITDSEKIFGGEGLSVEERDSTLALKRGVALNVQMLCTKAAPTLVELDALFAEPLKKVGYRVLSTALTRVSYSAAWEPAVDGWEAFVKAGPDRVNGRMIGQKYNQGLPTAADSMTLPNAAQVYALRALPADKALTDAKKRALGPLLQPQCAKLNTLLQRGTQAWTTSDTVATVQFVEDKSYLGLWISLLGAAGVAVYVQQKKAG